MDRDHDRLVNDILAGKVEPPPGFLEKYKIQMPGTDEEYWLKISVISKIYLI